MRPNRQSLIVLGAIVSAIALAASGARFADGATLNPDAASDSARWRPGFHRPGPDRGVSAITECEGLVTVGGSFKFIGATPAEGVARWNGESWEALGGGVAGSVQCLLERDGPLYAGGYLLLPDGLTRTGVAVWDGIQWTYLSGDIPLPVSHMAIHEGLLHAASGWRRTGPVSSIYRWNGAAWESTGDHFFEGDYEIAALQSFGDSLFASWNDVPGEESLTIWSPQPMFQDSTGWHPFSQEGDCYDCSVEVFDTMTTFAGRLVGGFDYSEYRGGNDWSHGGLVASWTGSFWRRIGNPLPDQPTSLVEHDGNLYAAVRQHGIYEWNSAAWRRLEDGPGDYTILGSTAPGLAAASYGQLPDGSWGSSIFLKEGDGWRDLTPSEGLGLDGGVNAMAIQDSAVIVIGDFAGSDTKECWTLREDAWVAAPPVGYSIEGTSVALYQGDLVAPGLPLDRQSGTRVILRLRDEQWEKIGFLNDMVSSLREHGDGLLAGGAFTQETRTERLLNHVAEYRDGAWRPMGGGIHGAVTALSFDGSELLAGGRFDSVGAPPVPARHVGRWNGSDWEGIGAGVAFPVNAVTFFKGCPVAAGVDPDSPADRRRGKAAWFLNGQWVDLGVFDGPVYALEVFRGRLVAGGRFRTIDGVAMPGLAWFDGVVWQPIAGGVDGTVRALATRNNELWVGGSFRSAGGVASSNIAVLDVPRGEPGPPKHPSVDHVPWPNPSEEAIHIPVILGEERHVRVTIHDVLGREVASIEDRVLPPGEHDLIWRGEAATGLRLASGVYFSRVEIDGRVYTRAFLRIR